MITRHGVLLWLHILLFVSWLGADLGVFYASRFMLRADLTAAARSTAAAIMAGLDLGPRISLILIAPVGLTLAADLGLSPLDGGALVAAWVLALTWLVLAVRSYLAASASATVKRADLAIRCAVAAGMLGWGCYSLLAEDGLLTDWLPIKVALYGLAVAAGIAIRLGLPAFGQAFSRVVSGDSTAETEAALRRALHRVEPCVWVIWACLLGASFLGTVQPTIG